MSALMAQAVERLADAYAALDFARECFEGFPSDITRFGVVDAEIEVEDAEAVYGEHREIGAPKFLPRMRSV